jgi:L-serine dehydratase
MTCKLMAGDKVLLEQEYYSVGGGFIEWKGYTPPKKGQPKYPYATMKELQQHAEKNKLSLAQVVMANEVAVSGERGRSERRSSTRSWARWSAIVKPGLAAAQRHAAGRSSSKTKAGEGLQALPGRRLREAARGRGGGGPYALAGLGGERARPPRGHRPTGGSAGVIPAIVYALGEGGRKLPPEKLRQGCSPRRASAISASTMRRSPGAEGGCQAEIGVRRRDGRGADRAGARLRSPGRSRTPPSRRSSTISA